MIFTGENAVVEDIEGDEGAAAAANGDEAGVVVYPKVVLEQDKHDAPLSGRRCGMGREGATAAGQARWEREGEEGRAGKEEGRHWGWEGTSMNEGRREERFRNGEKNHMDGFGGRGKV